jgi:DNA-3-methyladenine glycosylase
VDRRLDGADLLGDTLFITDPGPVDIRIVKRPRIGVDYAGAWARRLLRFYVRGSAHISRP